MVDLRLWETNLQHFIHVINISLKFIKTSIQQHQLFVRWMHGFLIVFSFIVDLELYHFVTQFLAVFQAADQWMIISVRVDGFVNKIDAILNFALLIFHIGEDLAVLLVSVSKLRFNGFKILENLNIFLTSLLITDDIVGVFKELTVHLVHILTGKVQVLFDSFF